MVYPMVDGISEEEGLKLMFFTDANILSNVVYHGNETLDDTSDDNTHEYSYVEQILCFLQKNKILLIKQV